MERILTIIILLLITSCQLEDSKNNKENALNNILNTITHHDIYVLSDMRNYIETNHLSDACSNDLMVEIITLVDFLDSAQTIIINKSGGFDTNGHLINRYDENNFKKMLEDIEFNTRLDTIVASINHINTNYSELVSESIRQDIKPFSFNSYEKTTLANIYIDLVLVKSNLINTEVKYFEMLKSNIDCNKDFR